MRPFHWFLFAAAVNALAVANAAASGEPVFLAVQCIFLFIALACAFITRRAR